MRWIIRFLLFFCILTLFSQHSEAYVRTTTKPNQQGFPLFWKTFPVEYHIHNQNFPAGLDPASVVTALNNSFLAWQTTCTCAKFAYKGLTADSTLGYPSDNPSSNKNLIIFQKENWKHDDRAIAVASVIFDQKNGEIVGFDIEINSAGFQFSLRDDVKPGQTQTVDLANTITHEAGHTLGIDHSPIQSATMFKAALPGETSKRSLDNDDQKAVCDIYPLLQSGSCVAAQDPNSPTVTSNTGCMCQKAPEATIPTLLLGLLGLLVWLFFLRRLY